MGKIDVFEIKSSEECISAHVELSEELRNAKEEFSKALRAFESKVKGLNIQASTLVGIAEDMEDINLHALVEISKLDTELRGLSARFNGLKCELT